MTGPTGTSDIDRALARAMPTVDHLHAGIPERDSMMALFEKASAALAWRLAAAAIDVSTPDVLPLQPAADALVRAAGLIFSAKWNAILAEAKLADRWSRGASRQARALQALLRIVTPAPQPTFSGEVGEQRVLESIQAALSAIQTARHAGAPVEPAVRQLRDAHLAGFIALWAGVLDACQLHDAERERTTDAAAP